MIINDKREQKTVRFDSLVVGDVFFDVAETEEFMMKTDNISDYCNNYNAVSLETGNYYYYRDNELVEIVKATLTISN